MKVYKVAGRDAFPRSERFPFPRHAKGKQIFRDETVEKWPRSSRHPRDASDLDRLVDWLVANLCEDAEDAC